MHEGSHISSLLKYLSISRVVDKGEQLVEYLLDVDDFLEVGSDETHFGDELLFLCSKSLFKLIF